MENQDPAAPAPGEIINPPVPEDRDTAEPHSGGDRLLYGKPHPDGASSAAAGPHAEHGTARARPRRNAIAARPLAAVGVAVAVGFLIGRIRP
jgi:hypothetical protein